MVVKDCWNCLCGRCAAFNHDARVGSNSHPEVATAIEGSPLSAREILHPDTSGLIRIRNLNSAFGGMSEIRRRRK